MSTVMICQMKGIVEVGCYDGGGRGAVGEVRIYTGSGARWFNKCAFMGGALI